MASKYQKFYNSIAGRLDEDAKIKFQKKIAHKMNSFYKHHMSEIIDTINDQEVKTQLQSEWIKERAIQKVKNKTLYELMTIKLARTSNKKSLDGYGYSMKKIREIIENDNGLDLMWDYSKYLSDANSVIEKLNTKVPNTHTRRLYLNTLALVLKYCYGVQEIQLQVYYDEVAKLKEENKYVKASPN